MQSRESSLPKSENPQGTPSLKSINSVMRWSLMLEAMFMQKPSLDENALRVFGASFHVTGWSSNSPCPM